MIMKSNLLLAMMVCVALAGCASSSIIVGKVRPAISIDQVKVYLHPPKKYEEVALVEASSRSSWAFTDQGKTDVVVQRLKEEAAKVGANGILLQGTGSEYGGSFGTLTGTTAVSGNMARTTGLGTSLGITHKTGNGVIIYVTEE